MKVSRTNFFENSYCYDSVEKALSMEEVKEKLERTRRHSAGDYWAEVVDVARNLIVRYKITKDWNFSEIHRWQIWEDGLMNKAQGVFSFSPENFELVSQNIFRYYWSHLKTVFSTSSLELSIDVVEVQLGWGDVRYDYYLLLKSGTVGILDTRTQFGSRLENKIGQESHRRYFLVKPVVEYLRVNHPLIMCSDTLN